MSPWLYLLFICIAAATGAWLGLRDERKNPSNGVHVQFAIGIFLWTCFVFLVSFLASNEVRTRGALSFSSLGSLLALGTGLYFGVRLFAFRPMRKK